MSKVGRNDPCPCGSGRKYKRCCQAEHRSKAESQVDLVASNKRAIITTPAWVFEEDSLDRDSNRVVNLIKEGRLDEAEEASRKLMRDYPEVHDGFERLAMVYEARGESAEALEMYQRALDFTLAHEELYDQEMPNYYRNKIARLKGA